MAEIGNPSPNSTATPHRPAPPNAFPPSHPFLPSPFSILTSTMEYRQLGPTGLKISALSFGAWVTFGNQIGDPVARKLLHTAYDAGVNFFDNAEGYAAGQAERVMGDILKKSRWRRSSYLVSSKVFFGAEGKAPNETGLSRKHVIEACHYALRRFQLEYLYLYYCHRPDPATPVAETCRAMHDLITAGKVLYLGTSEWSPGELNAAFAACAAHGLHAPVVEQPQYNLFHRARVEKELAPLYKKPGLGTTIWSPLASGLLTGKYHDGVPKRSRLDHPNMAWLRDLMLDPKSNIQAKLAAVQKLAVIAASLDTTLPRLALAWCLKNPHVSSVILGASRPEQLTENFGALDVVPRLTPAVMRQINALSAGI